MPISRLAAQKIAWSSGLAREISRVMTRTNIMRLPSKDRRQAAVMVPLCMYHGELGVLFTVRTDDVSTHKGQVSLPGGHIDPGESAEQAAVRETREEIPGLPDVVQLGGWHDAFAITGTHVSVQVGIIPEDIGDLLPAIKFNHHEVASVFVLPVRCLLDWRLSYIEDLRVAYTDKRPPPDQRAAHIPVFLGGPARVWGLTAYIVHGFLHEALVPALAAHLQLPIDTHTER